MAIETGTLGFPRIGRKRELKKALEAYWKGELAEAGLWEVYQRIESDNWQTQLKAGVDHIAVGDMSLYDHVLDLSFRLGLVPERFSNLKGLELYFALARGAKGAHALDLTKWFDTNYHYLVPELGDPRPVDPDFSGYLEPLKRGQAQLGSRASAVLLGPVTYLSLARTADLGGWLSQLLPVYRDLLAQIKALGVGEVQLHEPILVSESGPKVFPLVAETVQELALASGPIFLQTYFDDLGQIYQQALELPVAGIGLDFTRGENLALLQAHGFPDDKTLGAGVVDGRSVWRVRRQALEPVLATLQAQVKNLRLQPSSSLQFVPYSLEPETALPPALKGALAFADEKLAELRFLADSLESGVDYQEIDSHWQVLERYRPTNDELRARLKNLSQAEINRAAPYPVRRAQQIQLPLFPTTTIGSFPQTQEIRALRSRYLNGEIGLEAYQAGIDSQIAFCIGVQEGIGLDVLVHGEPERTDMVEYFAQKLTGFAFTKSGWVQSYGNRCVRPGIIYGDISRPEPMTVREFRVAQSFTKKPVKGMLTGPVTILNWSFPRTDLSRAEQAYQIAWALRQEIQDLEAAGAQVIQVDEPALREGLPLKASHQSQYLEFAVRSFRLATTVAKPETQIQTHMCYSEFGEILEAIEALDADVILIENARSDDATLRQLAGQGYPREVGPGVYDIHSPVVPSTEEILAKLESFFAAFPPERIWITPDCGLKTRNWSEVIPALRNMVAAAELLRAREQVHRV